MVTPSGSCPVGSPAAAAYGASENGLYVGYAFTQDKVDLVLGPFGPRITDPVADVTEKHKMPMVAPVAGTTYIPLSGTAAVRFSSRLSGAPGLWTARSSATPFQRWATTPSTADSGSIGMGSRSRTRWSRSSGRTARR